MIRTVDTPAQGDALADPPGEYLTSADVAAYGISPDGVRRRCPQAVEYGPASAPYWRGEDLLPLFDPD